MTKRRMVLSAGALALVLAGAVLLFWGPRPLCSLRTQDLAWVTLQMNPPGRSIRIEREDFAELVEILSQVTVCPAEDSRVVGQWGSFHIVKKNGTQLNIGICDPTITLDGVGYRCRGKSGARLQEFAESIWNRQTERMPRVHASRRSGDPRRSFRKMALSLRDFRIRGLSSGAAHRVNPLQTSQN